MARASGAAPVASTNQVVRAATGRASAVWESSYTELTSFKIAINRIQAPYEETGV
ncbi:hypothetical protein GCM10022278_40010 [Allohahella marinimesophila]|uniref:Uncharacterized protein n=1 Tax=Allohahella marinimesophila TaxID=1054972 RepID=A0ABP7QBH5_9GAMM